MFVRVGGVVISRIDWTNMKDFKYLNYLSKEELFALAEAKYNEMDAIMNEIHERFPPKKEYVYGFCGGKVHQFYAPESDED